MSEEGLPPREATHKAMGQISGAVVGITAVLISVFVPLAMFSGATGKIYQQFAITMVLSIAFSAFLALSLTPALCASLLKPIEKGHHEEKTGFFGWFNRKFTAGNKRYEGWVAALLHRAGRMLIVYLALVAAAGLLYTRIPSSFLPSEDQGNLMVSIQLPAGATKERTDQTLLAVEQIAQNTPGVKDVFTVSGFSFSGSGQNMAMGFVILKNWDERKGPGEDAASITQKLTGAFMASGLIRDGFAIAVNPPPIRELGNGGLEFYLQDRNSRGHQALVEARDKLIAEMRKNPMFGDTRAAGLEDAPQLKLTIDRAAAAAQGISMASIRSTLGSALGGAYVNDFPNNGRLQKVYVQAVPQSRMQAEQILAMTVPNGQGVAVPLSTVVSASWETGMEQSTRFNGYPAMSISGAVKTGFASGDAMAEVERIVSQMDGYSVEWAGESRQQANGSSQRTMLYGFVLLATFLVLAALYESWSIPAAVLLVAPLGFLGVVLGVFGRNLFNGLLGIREVFFNDIYFMVGMITVVGLSAKNAILIIEFAKDLQAQGKSAMESALAAAHLRFRPILMTSFAFILGVVPLYVASGASSASQRAIGTAVFWGMSVGTLLSVFLVPLFYVLVRKLFKPSRHETEMAAAHTNISPEQAELYVSAAEQGLSEEEKRDLHNDQ